jgi:dihydroorotate dehydrogenase subfamily 1
LKFKNPVISASDDFGGDARMAERVLKQGIGGLVTKCIHRDIGSERWPRPYFFSLRRFGMPNAMICQEMFSHIKYEKWIETVGPEVVKMCRKHDAKVIVNIAGKGAETEEDRESWQTLAREQEGIGADVLELDIGGPHGVFGQPEEIKVAAAMGVDPEKAATVTRWVKEVTDLPVIPKMTPLATIANVALAVQKAGADAVTANNALYGIFIDHETGSFYGTPASCGYLSRDFLPFSLAKVLELTTTLNIPVLGCGGIWNCGDGVRYIMAGCPAFQVSSAKYFRGPNVLKEIIDGLKEYMSERGYESIENFRGRVMKEVRYIRDLPRESEIISPWIRPSPITPRFDMKKCSYRCRICEKMCPYNAIILDKEKGNSVDDKHCMGCGMCVGVCPQGAITLIERRSGEEIWNGRGVARFKKWDEM